MTSISSSAFNGVCNGDNAIAGATVGHVFDNEYDAECNNGCGYIRDVSGQPGDDDPCVTPGGDNDTPEVPEGNDDNPDAAPEGEGSGNSTIWLAAIIGVIVMIAVIFFIVKSRREI